MDSLKVIEEFLSSITLTKRQSLHTKIAYSIDLHQFNDFLAHDYPSVPILQTELGHVRSWVVLLSKEKLLVSSINRKLSALRAFFQYCKLKEYIQKSPMEFIRTLKAPKRLPVIVKQSEFKLLFTSEDLFPNTFEGKRDFLIFELLYGTGIRLSELIGLKNTDVDIEKKRIKVLGKRRKERIIPLNIKAMEAVKEYQNWKTEMGLTDIHFLVSSKDEKVYPVLIQRIVKKYLSLVSNTSQKSPHTLRHSFATHLLDEGAKIQDIKELLGHSNLNATQIYTHTSIETLKNQYKKAHPRASREE